VGVIRFLKRRPLIKTRDLSHQLFRFMDQQWKVLGANPVLFIPEKYLNQWDIMTGLFTIQAF
jgi:hypothetical protein